MFRKYKVFWPRKSVSDDMRFWILECFDWFDEKFEPPQGPVLPTKEFFKAPSGANEANAKLVLADVKRLMGFDTPTELFPLDVLPAELRYTYQTPSDVAGTHEKIDGISVIRYDPEQLHRPIQFINLITHELIHARLSGMENEIPGGEEAHELATDLGCITSGFGVFQMQAADDAGWAGYLSQQSRALSLAIFLKRRELGQEAVAPYLSSRCNKLLRRAIKEL